MNKKEAFVTKHPLLLAGALAAIYVGLDHVMLTGARECKPTETLFYITISLLLFFLVYPMRKKSEWIGFACVFAFTILGIGIWKGWGNEWFPGLDAAYYPSELALFLLIAPVLEELTFRYLLYDMWAKKKYGKWWGMAASGLIFVLCHPITGWQTLCLYWIPALMLYLVYEDWGIYGSILAHVIYNFFAL